MHGKDFPFDTVCMPNHYRGKRVSKSAMCAVSRENKRAHTPVEDKQGFQRYDISIIPAQDMNCSVILMVKGALHSRTVGAERHVLHMVNCLAAGIPRSAAHPPLLNPFQAPVSSPGSNLQTQSSPAGSSLGCWVELDRILFSPSGLLLIPLLPLLQRQHPPSTPSQVSSEVVYCLLLTQLQTIVQGN